METEKKYKWSLAGLIVMILLNAVTLSIIWIDQSEERDWKQNKIENKERKSSRHFMQKELGLRDSQSDSIATLRRDHFREIRTMRRNLEHIRREYFDALMDSNPDTQNKQDSLLQAMTQQYIAIETSMHRHMLDIKSVLNEEQQQKFEQMVKNTFFMGRGGATDRHRRLGEQ